MSLQLRVSSHSRASLFWIKRLWLWWLHPTSTHPPHCKKGQASIGSWVRTLILDYPEERRAEGFGSSSEVKCGLIGQVRVDRKAWWTLRRSWTMLHLLHEKMRIGDQGTALCVCGHRGDGHRGRDRERHKCKKWTYERVEAALNLTREEPGSGWSWRRSEKWTYFFFTFPVQLSGSSWDKQRLLANPDFSCVCTCDTLRRKTTKNGLLFLLEICRQNNAIFTWIVLIYTVFVNKHLQSNSSSRQICYFPPFASGFTDHWHSPDLGEGGGGLSCSRVWEVTAACADTEASGSDAWYQLRSAREESRE